MKRLFVVCLLAIVAACGGESPADPGVSLTGTWRLQSINGANLPYSATDSGVVVSITAATLTISTNGTYSETFSVSAVEGATTVTTTVIQAGNWSNSGGTITFNDTTDGATYSGSLSGAVLTAIPGSVEVFVR